MNFSRCYRQAFDPNIMLYNDYGKKLKDLLNSLFPGLIREPQPVRVPVQRPDERQRGMRR